MGKERGGTTPSTEDLLRQVGSIAGGGRNPPGNVGTEDVIGFGEETQQPGIAGLQPFSSENATGPSGVAFVTEKDLSNGHHAGVIVTGFGSKDEDTHTVVAGGGVYLTGGEGPATGSGVNPDTGRPAVPAGTTGGYVGFAAETAWQQGPEVDTSGLRVAVQAGLNVAVSRDTRVRFEAAHVVNVSGESPADVGALGAGSGATACATHNLGHGVQVGACVGADKQNGKQVVLGLKADF